MADSNAVVNEKTVEGGYDKAKGDVKQEVGSATGNANLEAEGTFDKVKGAVKEGIGKAEDAVKNL